MTDRPDRSLRFRFAWRAGAMALVLAAAVGLGLGWFWQSQVRSAIRSGVADHLRALVAELDLAALPLAEAQSPIVLPSPERFVQVVTPGGDVVAASSELTTTGPLVPVGDVAGVPGTFEATISDPSAPGRDAFVMARRITVGDVDYIGIVGAPFGPVDNGRRFTYVVVGLGAPLLGLVVAVGVWVAVTLALRPVNELTREADRIARGSGSWRLGVEPDTVELRELARSLDKLLAHIRDTFDRERLFLDDASHELRTPIAVARGELDLARSSAAGEEVLAALESALEELDRLDRLAADLLVLARARGGRSASFTTCDLGGIARRVAGGVMRGARARRVQLRVSGEATVDGDEQALDRALANVVANAVDFCRDSVDIDLDVDGDEAIVTVVDDGPGFPPGFLDTAFNRFAKQRARPSDGTGLGLAIAAAIVEAHTGTIEAANLRDGGARVTIRLPRHAGLAPRRAANLPG